MISISTQDISLSFGTDVILKDVSFALNDGDRVGVIGVNGAGKSSLFKIISGEYEADAGSVYIQKGHRVGMLEQNPDLSLLPPSLSAVEYMYTAFADLLELEKKISDTEAKIAEKADTGTDVDALSLASKLSEYTRIYTEQGGLEFRGRCKSMLLRLGFSEEDTERKISNLSGGQYTRLSLARLLLTEPDILMLDEPTNHLDIDSLEWLEGFLSSYKKTVLIISHDRYFLDRTTTKTLHILNGRARLFGGSYSATVEMRLAEAASLEKRYKEQQKEIAKIRANIEFQRRCNREHNFVTIRSKEKQLARMQLVELAPRDPRDIRLSFDAESESATDVLLARELCFSYGERTFIKDLSFLVRRGERVFFLGPNGSGKSTLMKLLNSRLSPKSGSITLGYNIKIGYYDQENRGLSENKSVLAELWDEYPDRREEDIRGTLALFLFRAEDIERSVATLSGGERARLTLAKLIMKKVNLLILDEPTNHLDIGSREALENALLAFPGTIIAVSHDRYFINRIATRIIELAPTRRGGMVNYELEEYDDAFTEYMKLRTLAEVSTPTETEKAESSRAEYERRKQENARQRGEARAKERARERTAALEAELAALDEELFGSAATDYKRAAEIDTRKNEIEEELLGLYELVL